MFNLYKGKTFDGNWVYGNLIYTEDAKDEFKAVIIPSKNNGQ